MPEPVIAEEQDGVSVTFLKDIFTEEYLEKAGLTGRPISAVLFIKEKGSITNSQYQELNNLGKSVSTTDLQDLVEKGIIVCVGKSGRGIRYVLGS